MIPIRRFTHVGLHCANILFKSLNVTEFLLRGKTIFSMFAFSSQKHILVLAPDPHKPFLMNLNSGGIILAGILMPSRNLKFGEFPPPKIALRPSTIGFFCGKKTELVFKPIQKNCPKQIDYFSISK